MNDAKRILTVDEIAAENLAGWQVDGDALRAVFTTGDFATGLALVVRIGEAAEAADHHPDLALSYPTLGVTLSSHDVGGITRRDVDLARHISTLAGEADVTAESAR